MNPVHNAPVELPSARFFLARAAPPPPGDPLLHRPALAALPWPPPPYPVCHHKKTELHRERAVTGGIFQALSTQIDTTTVAFIYKIKESNIYLWDVHLLLGISQSSRTNHKVCNNSCDPKVGGKLVLNFYFINLYSFIDSLSIFNMVSKLGFLRGKFVLHDILVCSKVLKF